MHPNACEFKTAFKSSWPSLVFAFKCFQGLVEYFISSSQLHAQYNSRISTSSRNLILSFALPL